MRYYACNRVYPCCPSNSRTGYHSSGDDNAISGCDNLLPSLPDAPGTGTSWYEVIPFWQSVGMSHTSESDLCIGHGALETAAKPKPIPLVLQRFLCHAGFHMTLGFYNASDRLVRPRDHELQHFVVAISVAQGRKQPSRVSHPSEILPTGGTSSCLRYVRKAAFFFPTFDLKQVQRPVNHVHQPCYHRIMRRYYAHLSQAK